MTNFPHRESQRPGYYDDMGSGAGASPGLIIGVIVGVLIVGGLIYSFSGASVSPNQGATHQITQPAAPTTSPALPSPTPKP